MSLPQTTPLLIIDVKREDDVAEERSDKSVELSAVAKNMYELLQFVINSVCIVDEVSFQKRLETTG